ncbi:MAG: general stress protein CsbD [Ferruginibacter sp.]|nr:general stress protein CsbD [Chitinophagaceae bacterium]
MLKLMTPWPDVKEKIKETNAELTDEDLNYTPGKEEELLQHLGKKMSRTPEEIKVWIESLSSNKGKAS